MREKHGFFCEISATIWVESFAPGEQRDLPSRDRPPAHPHFAIFHTESVNYAYWRHVLVGNWNAAQRTRQSFPPPVRKARILDHKISFTIKPY
jgi:hypothetical protein